MFTNLSSVVLAYCDVENEMWVLSYEYLTGDGDIQLTTKKVHSTIHVATCCRHTAVRHYDLPCTSHNGPPVETRYLRLLARGCACTGAVNEHPGGVDYVLAHAYLRTSLRISKRSTDNSVSLQIGTAVASTFWPPCAVCACCSYGCSVQAWAGAS